MSQFLQISQLIFFITPIVFLGVIGLIILIKPVAVINRRWYLGVVIPLLLDNVLALIENSLENDLSLISDWRFWLVLFVDILLIVGGVWMFRGFQIFGLGGSELVRFLVDKLKAKGLEVSMQTGQKTNLWGVSSDALVLKIENVGDGESVWVTERMNELLLQTDSPKGRSLLREILPLVGQIRKPYVLKYHAMGILYIVLAVLLGVFGWIFFFEPRLVIVE